MLSAFPHKFNRATFLCGLAWLLAWLLLPNLAAYQVKSQRFVPDQYYLGEKVRVILEVDYPGLRDISGPQVIEQQLPSNLDYQIDQVRITPASTLSSYIIEISYALYNNETNQLAAFSVGDFAIEAITIPRALSSAEAQLRPSLESNLLSLPWVDLSIALLIQVLILLPIILLQSSKKLRNWLHEWRKHYLEKKPYRQFLRQLHLILQKETPKPQEYYRILSSQVRYYLGHRTPYPCVAYTTEELGQLNLDAVLPQELWQNVLKLMSNSDKLRFGSNQKSAVSAAQKHKEIHTLIEFAKSVEQLFHSKEKKLDHV